MIIDQIINSHKYYSLNPRLEKAFEFLKTNDLASMPEGRYEVDGDRVVALVQEYTSVTTGPWEYHKHHIDVQYIVSGEEKIGCYPAAGLKPTQAYDIAHDHTHLEDVDGDFLTLKDDAIILIFPEDAHLHCMAIDQPIPIKKVVMKVLI